MHLLLPSWRPLSSEAGTRDDDHVGAVCQAIQASGGQQGTTEQRFGRKTQMLRVVFLFEQRYAQRDCQETEDCPLVAHPL
jgi:hypothetical protein